MLDIELETGHFWLAFDAVATLASTAGSGGKIGLIMNLKIAVENYLAVMGEFGRPMPLTAFGLDQNATETMLATWEEDYQLHRHMELIPAGPASPEREGREEAFVTAAQTRYAVGGVEYTGIVFRASIRTVIG